MQIALEKVWSVSETISAEVETGEFWGSACGVLQISFESVSWSKVRHCRLDETGNPGLAFVR